VFAQEPPVFEYPTTDEEMIQILSCYYRYFVFVFGKRHSPEEGKKYLHDLFCQEFSFPKWFPLPWIEGFIGYKVHRLGYHYLGGTTSAYYGPYIWKTTEKTVYSVEIPSRLIVPVQAVGRRKRDFIAGGIVMSINWINLRLPSRF
jgi:hypothetical protein